MISNYLLITANIYKKNSRLSETFVNAAIIWTVSIYAGVLFLSSFKRLEYVPVAGAYIVANIALLMRLLMKRKEELSLLYEKLRHRILEVIREIFTDKRFVTVAILIVLYLIVLGIVACVAVPYNYDSISYHAPRVHQWVQNKSVFYYASHIERQNASTVLASYISTVIHILTGGLTGSLCVLQYVANVICLLFINYICKYFSVRIEYRLFASVLWITLPIGFAEAITPQNDIVAAMWLLMFVSILLHLLNDREVTQRKLYKYIIELAILISLAYLTKPAVCFAIVIFLFWYFVECIKRKYTFINIVKQCIIAAGVVVLMIVPQMFQNYVTYGHIAADRVGKNQLIGTLQPQYVLLNLTKNAIFNFGFSAGNITNVNIIKKILYGLAMALKINLDAEAISEFGFAYGYASLPNYTCDAAIIMPLSLFAIVALAIFLFVRRNLNGLQRKFITYSYVSFLMLCAFLRWEKYISRYMIGYFALLIIAIAIIVNNIRAEISKKISYKLAAIVVFILVMSDIVGGLGNLYRIHPVIPIKSSMSMYNHNIDEYQEICDYINSREIQELGLIEVEDDNEYALWLMLDSDIFIRHVNLKDNNPYKKYERMDILPEIIISSRYRGDEMKYNGMIYNLSKSNECWYLYE